MQHINSKEALSLEERRKIGKIVTILISQFSGSFGAKHAVKMIYENNCHKGHF